MARKRDPYVVLGVAKTASETEIKRAFRELARKHHPDVNPDGGERFREINDAYAIVSDRESRARYVAGYTDRSGAGGAPAGADPCQFRCLRDA